MVNAAVSLSQELELTEEIIDLANEKQDRAKWINKSLKKMRELSERIEALNQVPGNADELVEKIRVVIRRLEDVKDTSKKMESQMRMAAIYQKPIYWIQRSAVTKEIIKIKTDTKKAVQLLQLPLKYNFTIKEEYMPGEVSLVSEILNYRDIPFYLRQCIYYFLLFPSNFEIPARRLIVLWVAEGLISPDNVKDNESAEHAAGRYLDELIERNVISGKKKLNGNVKSCQLTDSRRDKLLEMANEARFFHQNSGLISRLVDHNGTSPDSCFIRINGKRGSLASVSCYRNVLSLLSFNTQEGSKPGEDIGDFLRKCIAAGCFRWMRILDLEQVFRPKLPKTLSKLTLLRYLGLRWTYLENLPDFVNKFFNLQVLDVKHTYISVLPKSIWRMQYLRHLYLSETYGTRFDGRPSDGITMNELQTLWGASIDEKTVVKGGLDTLGNIRKLGLSCRPSSSSRNTRMPEQSEAIQSSSSQNTPEQSEAIQSISSQNTRMSEQLEAVEKWISRLQFLETLRLKSQDELGKTSDLPLSCDLPLRWLKQKKNLSTIYLLGTLQRRIVSEFPESLIDITLSGSKLAEDPMESLGKLPNLRILRLLSESVEDTTMLCRKDSFFALKVLKIWKLDKLEKWEAEKDSLRSLEELEIRSCEKLEKLPDLLQHVRTLKELRLKRMPKGFINEIKENQSLWKKFGDVLKVD